MTFPPFRLDGAEERLWQGEKLLALRRKPFAILRYLAANPRRAMETLGWKARTTMAGVAKKMVEAERNRLAGAQESKEQEDR